MNLRVGFEDLWEVYDFCEAVRECIKREIYGQVYGVYNGGFYLQTMGLPIGFLDETERVMHALTRGRLQGWCKQVRYQCVTKIQGVLDVFRERDIVCTDSGLVWTMNSEAMDALGTAFHVFIKANVFHVRYSGEMFGRVCIHRLSVWTDGELRERMLAFCMGGSKRLGGRSLVSLLCRDAIDSVCVCYILGLSSKKIERCLML